MVPGSLGEWLIGFRKLHARAVKGQLSASEGVAYYRGRNELAKVLFGLQQLTLQPGQIPRQWIRISHPIQVEIEIKGVRLQALTVDLSLSGFGALMDREPTPNELTTYVLHLPGTEVKGQARVVDVRQLDSGTRASFNFQGLAETERERLELFIFDIVLSKLT